MGIFEQFPYTNFHDLNLDWILHAIQSMDKKLDEFVASNVLSYAEPIQWDIETQYAKNTVVVDPKTGTAYMSINPVPVGQLLTNKYYWQPIFNYDEIVNTLKKQIAAIQADQHDTIPVAVGRGGLVWVVNKLYRLTKSLDAGSKIIENENAVPVTVEDAIINIDTTKNITRNTDGTITDTAGTITRKSDSIIDTANAAISVSGKTITNAAADSITNSSTNITDTASAGITRNAATITDTATAGITRNAATITDTASGASVRSGNTIADTAGDTFTRNAVTITDSATGAYVRSGNTITDTATSDVSVIGKNIINTADNISISATGDLTENASERSATFTNDTEKITGNKKIDVDGELYFNTKNPIKYSQPVSNLNDFFNIVPYVDNNGDRYNVLCDNGNTVNLSSNHNFKNYILVGDSYASGYTPEGAVTGWTTLLDRLLKGKLYAKIEQGGAGLSDKMSGDYNLTTRITSLTSSDSVDSIICCCGRNDIDGDNVYGIEQGIKNFVEICHLKFKNAKVYIGFIGWDLNITEYTETKSLDLRRAIAAYKSVNADYIYINTDFILRQRSYMASDGKHPNQDGQNALAYGIKCALYGGIPSYTKPFAQHRFKDQYSINDYVINETFTGGISCLQFICNGNAIQYKGPTNSITMNGYELHIVKNIELDYLVPSHYKLTSMQANIVIKMSGDVYYNMNVPVYFKDNGNGTWDLVMLLVQISRAGNSWASGTIDYIELYGSIVVANALT